jgi:hypothetical protein
MIRNPRKITIVTFWIGLGFIMSFCLSAANADVSAEVTVSKAAQNEQQEREVDQVALSSQDLAISRLLTLLKKYRETSQEPVFLS